MRLNSGWRYGIHFIHELTVTVAGVAALLLLLNRWSENMWVYAIPLILMLAVGFSGLSLLCPLTSYERNSYRRWGYLKLPILAGLGLICSGSDATLTTVFNGALIIQSLLVVRDVVTGRVFH